MRCDATEIRRFGRMAPRTRVNGVEINRCVCVRVRAGVGGAVQLSGLNDVQRT